jgi:hypothetical protein
MNVHKYFTQSLKTLQGFDDFSLLLDDFFFFELRRLHNRDFLQERQKNNFW